jgi:hypothetical protein
MIAGEHGEGAAWDWEAIAKEHVKIARSALEDGGWGMNLVGVKALAELEALRGKVAALERDKARLDWLDQQKPPGWEQVLLECDAEGHIAAVNFCHEGYDDAQSYCGETWRETIDAAIDAGEETK